MQESEGDLKVSELLESWLESIRPGMRPSSYTIYQGTVRKHLSPLMGEIAVSELSEEKGRFLADRLRENGLSERSAGDTMRKFQQALTWGRRQGMCSGTGFRLSVPSVRTQRLRFLTAEEQEKLEAYLTRGGEAAHLAVLLALDAGLTVGEVCALRWEDVDRCGNRVRVSKTLQRVSADGETRVEVLPLDRREAPLPEKLARLLEKLPCEKAGWLLPGKKAQLTEPRTMQQRLKRYLSECGLGQDISFSTLRDTFIRRCMEGGMDFIEVGRITGCADFNELWRRYGRYYRR